jgi:hypothetical protein
MLVPWHETDSTASGSIHGVCLLRRTANVEWHIICSDNLPPYVCSLASAVHITFIYFVYVLLSY